MEVEEFFNEYGTSKTSNFDLKDILKDLNLKSKVIMRDEIKNYQNAENIIFNYQTTKEKGSHWVLCSSKYNIYFDSFGIDPVNEVHEYLKSEFKYNTLQVQPNNTEMCGQLCVFVLYRLSNNSTFEDIILELSEQISEFFNR